MNNDTLLLRQVHPSFIQASNISVQVFSSQIFKPTLKDNNQLSVYNGEKFSPEESFNHYTENFKSAGVVAVTVNECIEVGVDCIEDNMPFDGHAYIDYKENSSPQVEKIAKKLKVKAASRGWLYQQFLQ